MQNKDQERNEHMGGLAGLGAGVIAGAQVGTVVIPIPFVGTFVGAMAGGVLGTTVGQRVGAAAIKSLNTFVDSVTAPQPKSQQLNQGTTNPPQNQEGQP